MSSMQRRQMLTWLACAVPATLFTSCAGVPDRIESGSKAMYGLIGRMKTHPGQRDKMISILLEGTNDMPGCLSYVVAADATDTDSIWITEVWVSKENHQASLALPSVRAAIAQGRPLIAGFGERFETLPRGGQGLKAHP